MLELRGPLFFGTADALALRIEAAEGQKVAHVILDLKRVNDGDSTCCP